MAFRWRILVVCLQLLAFYDASPAWSAKRGKHIPRSHWANHHMILQIESGNSPNGAVMPASFEMLKDRKVERRQGVRDLAQALIEEPNPRTNGLLAEPEFPAIAGVPPIAIIRSGNPEPASRAGFAAALGFH